VSLVLTIRKEQVEALDRASRVAFEDETVGHLMRLAPRLGEIYGEPRFREVVRLGIERAEGFGFTNRGPVRLYAELMVILGSEFAVDPLLPWAAEALNAPDVPDQMHRADRLYRSAVDYLDAVVGADDHHLIDALRRLDGAQFTGYPIEADDYEDYALGRLRSIYPQKCDCAGERALRELVRRGFERAESHGARTSLGVCLFIVLPFVLGHGVFVDPFYPWVARALEDPALPDPGKRVERLLTRTKTYLGEALGYLGRGGPDAEEL
jgi:hypothetical protein